MMLGSSCSPCCAAGPECFSACDDSPQFFSVAVSADQSTGSPWVEPEVYANTGLTKVSSITLPAISLSLVFDMANFTAQDSGWIALDAATEYRAETAIIQDNSNQAFPYQRCDIVVTVRQVVSTMSSQGVPAYTGYAFEERRASATASFWSSGAALVTKETRWGGMRYGASGGGGTPLKLRREWWQTLGNSSAHRHCKQFHEWPKVVDTAQSVGGFPGPLIDGGGGFCLIPQPNGQAPEPGEQYGFMVGWVDGCIDGWFGNQVRVGSDITCGIVIS